MRKRAVFLDRDGVLNESLTSGGVRVPPRRLEEFRLLPGVEEATARLSNAGFILVVVTNQPDVARGTLTCSTLEAIHQRIARALPLDAIECCQHDDADGCECRKPKPGMILRAGIRLDVDFTQSFMVGDRWRDVAAGRAAGCHTIYISPSEEDLTRMPADAAYPSLLAASDDIIFHPERFVSVALSRNPHDLRRYCTSTAFQPRTDPAGTRHSD